MPVTVRFAPSPTGRLHVGNIRVAVLNFLLAKAHHGTFMLRLDDTDAERSTQASADGIERDLTWLGLTWGLFARQSDRLARYHEVADTLRASGRLYACYETADELDRRRKRQMAAGHPPIYDRAALKLSAADHARFAEQGIAPHWRFRLANTELPTSLNPAPTIVSWNDLIRGDQTVDVGSLSDPVLVRGDGTPLYTFTTVVDDIDFAITHIIRGEDHVTNSAVQIQLFEALGAPPPAMGHHSLLIGADGSALSKRLDSLSIEGFRAGGLEPMAVLSHAALIGTSHAIAPHANLDSLVAGFSLAKISTAPARFDLDELRSLNARLLHQLPFEAVDQRLAALGIKSPPDDTFVRDFWAAVRPNITVFADVADWWRIVGGEVNPVVEDAATVATAARLLPPAPWDRETWRTWTNAVKAETGLKGRALFHPLRLALTGMASGPDMGALLPLLREDAVRRHLATGGRPT